jgi:hypothetical protein
MRSDAGPVDLAIFDVAGHRVHSLVACPQGRGRSTVRWDGSKDNGGRAATGIDSCRLEAKGHRTCRRMALVK